MNIALSVLGAIMLAIPLFFLGYYMGRASSLVEKVTQVAKQTVTLPTTELSSFYAVSVKKKHHRTKDSYLALDILDSAGEKISLYFTPRDLRRPGIRAAHYKQVTNTKE